MAVRWHDYWTEDGPYRVEKDRRAEEIAKASDEAAKKLAQKALQPTLDAIHNWAQKGQTLDWLYGYTKHLAVIITNFCVDINLLDIWATTPNLTPDDDAENWLTAAKDKSIALMVEKTTLKKLRIIVVSLLGSLEHVEFEDAAGTATFADVFDQCVLPIKPRPHGAIPRAFLGSDVAETGEGMGFMRNKLSHYLRHPSVVPKAELLNWEKYDKNYAELGEYTKWYYSLKYDGWSAIWTGTKLVTANGRQTITSMPIEMQDALIAVRAPLLGELVLLQADGRTAYTKEDLHVLVKGSFRKTKDEAKRDEIARRVVFMVYDTPSTEYASENYAGRLKKLEELLHWKDEARDYSIAQDKVQLIQQTQITRNAAETLGEALFAATAAEQEGLMLTPNEPYVQLHTERYRRRKVKPLLQFTVTPKTVEFDPKNPVAGARLASALIVELPELPPTFLSRDTSDTLKINIEGGIWADTTIRTRCLRMSKHRWGFHPVLTDHTAEREDPLGIIVRPTQMLKSRSATLQSSRLDLTQVSKEQKENQLWMLVAAHFIHPNIFNMAGRPHYPTHSKQPIDGTGEIAQNLYVGEASTEEVRGYVREASVLAEFPAKPYNEWLCRLHRAYENTRLWNRFLVVYPQLAVAEYTLDAFAHYRVPLIPGTTMQFYKRDLDHAGAESAKLGYTVYKLVDANPVPEEETFEGYEPANLGEYYYILVNPPTPLPRRIAQVRFSVVHFPESQTRPKLPDNWDPQAAHFFFNQIGRDFKTDRIVSNYVLSLAEDTPGIFNMISAAFKDRMPEIKTDPKTQEYTLVYWKGASTKRDYFLATIDTSRPTPSWLFASGYLAKDQDNMVSLVTQDRLIEAETVLKIGRKVDPDTELANPDIFPIEIRLKHMAAGTKEPETVGHEWIFQVRPNSVSEWIDANRIRIKITRAPGGGGNLIHVFFTSVGKAGNAWQSQSHQADGTNLATPGYV